MLRLAVATSIPEIHLALAYPCTGLYDVDRHMYLRMHYTTVFYVGQGSRSMYTHKDYVEGAGYAEHNEFIDKLQTPKELEPISHGPQNTSKRGKNAKANTKACSETFILLSTPSNHGVEPRIDNPVVTTRTDPEPPAADGDLRTDVATVQMFS